MGLEEAAAPNRSIFQSLSYNQPISNYVGKLDYNTPIARLQDVQDKADLLSTFIKPVNALEADSQERNAIHENYKKRLGEIAQIDNPYQQLKATKKLAQEYSDNVTTGKLGAINNSHATHTENAKRAAEALSKGDISQIGYWNAVSKPLQDYKGVQELAPEVYKGYSATPFSKEADIHDEVSKSFNHFAANSNQWIKQGEYWIDKKTHEHVSPERVKEAVVKYTLSNPKYTDQLRNMVKYHDQYGTGNGLKEVGNLVENLASSIVGREAYDKHGIDRQWDPLMMHFLKEKVKAEDAASNIPQSETEVVNNPNHKDLLSDVDFKDNKFSTTQYYKKEIDYTKPLPVRFGADQEYGTKEVPISESEYRKKQKEAETIDKKTGKFTANSFAENYGIKEAKAVEPKDLYGKNKEFTDLVNRQTKIDYRKYQDHFSMDDAADYPNPYVSGTSGRGALKFSYINKVATNYKNAVDNNKEIALDQNLNDTEQSITKGSQLHNVLQTATFIPLDNNAKTLAKQPGGDLDYQQLTEGGWEPVKVKDSGEVIGTGTKHPVASRAVITLKKGSEEKTVSVLMKSPNEAIQNSFEAQKASEVKSIIQSRHDGQVKIGTNLIAHILTDYGNNGTAQAVEYRDKNGNIASNDDLNKAGIHARTANELFHYFEGHVSDALQLSGQGFRGKKTDSTTDLNID